MKSLVFAAMFLVASCTQKVVLPKGQSLDICGAKIEQPAYADGQVYIVHFPREVLAADFKMVDGVTVIQQSDKYSILVRIGRAFDAQKVLEKLICSESKKGGKM